MPLMIFWGLGMARSQGHPAECLVSGLVYVGSTQFNYQAAWRQTFCGVSQGINK
jgi:hypothetical protein